MKKNIAILLMLLMLATPIAGCMSNDDASTEETSKISDSDSDGVPDSIDNCPDLFNPDQSLGFEGYECDEDERFTLDQPNFILKSGGGNGVTTMNITQDSSIYTLNEIVGADFEGTWFTPASNIAVSAHLLDSSGNIVYNNLFSFNGWSTSLDTLYPNDPNIGGHIWEESGPNHPVFSPMFGIYSNGYDFSASTLGPGEFCWWASIEAKLLTGGNGQYTVDRNESEVSTECFEIVTNPPNNNSVPNDNVTSCSSHLELYTDIYSTNITDEDAEGRLQADYNTFHSAPWTRVIRPPMTSGSWGSAPSPSMWAWPDLAAAGWTNDPNDFIFQNIDLKISFDIPVGATDVTAEFNGKVDNLFIPVQHPGLAPTASYDPKSAVIQNSATQSLTAWQMPEIQMPDHDWFVIGQNHVGWLPDNTGNSPESYDLLVSARNRAANMGVALTLEVRYCLENTTTNDDGTGNDDNVTGVDDDHNQTHDNHPPHIDAEVYFTAPAMLDYVFTADDTAENYNYSAFISWDTWDIDGIVETVEVDYDRDGVADIMLPENESPYYHLVYPYHLGVEFETAIVDNICYIMSFRMIDLIATDDDGDSVTYTIRTGTDEVNDWDYPENDHPVTTRRDAQWLMDVYLVQDTQYVDWIYGIGNSECPSPIELEFEENQDPLTDTGLIGTLNIISMGDESYPSNHMIGGTISAVDPVSGIPVTNSCGVLFVYSNPAASNLAPGESWQIFEGDSGDGLVCGIDPLDVTSYTWDLNIGAYSFNLPNMYYTIT